MEEQAKQVAKLDGTAFQRKPPVDPPALSKGL